MRRAILVATGVMLGGLAATVFAALALTFEAGTLDPQTALGLVRSIALALAMAGADPTGLTLAAGLHLLWLTLVLVGFGPVALAALLGELFGQRTLLEFVLVAGLASVALPAAALALLADHAQALRPLALIAFQAGALGGFVHWLVAGRHRAGV